MSGDYLDRAHREGCVCAKCTEPAAAATVDHPTHYRPGTYEAINVIEAWDLGFCIGNVVKYLCRAGLKTADVLEDLKKARWYLDREIARRERGGD